jgi:hypothetical protein
VPVPRDDFPAWLIAWMQKHHIALWGAADLEGFSTPRDSAGCGFPRALAWALPLNPHIMAGIQSGPNQAYADEYARVNQSINELAAQLAHAIRGRGFQAQALAASERTDTVNIKGDFPHKTAATRAGLGWIGRHCQLVTNKFGPWVRLGTVFTDMDLPCGPPPGEELLRPLHPLRRGLPGGGPGRRHLASGSPPGAPPQCPGLRSVEKRALLSIPPGAQLRHLRRGVSVWTENAQKEVRFKQG